MIEAGQPVERDVSHSVDASVSPAPIEAKAHFSSPTIRAGAPQVEWPTDEELDSLDVHGDVLTAALLLHPPGEGDPDHHWITELVINGEWEHLYRVGSLPEDAILDASISLTDYAARWWALLQQRRAGGFSQQE